MLEASLSYIILRTIPESLVLVLSGIILMNISLNLKDLLRNSIFLTVLVCIIRNLPINFGVHTILSMIVLGFIFYRFTSCDLTKSVIFTFIVFIALAFSEGIYVLMATNILNIPIHILRDNSSIQGALVTLPSLLITLCMVVICKKFIVDKFTKYIRKG